MDCVTKYIARISWMLDKMGIKHEYFTTFVRIDEKQFTEYDDIIIYLMNKEK